MLNRVIKSLFMVLGIFTGFTLAKTVLIVENFDISGDIKILIYSISIALFAFLFYFLSSKMIGILVTALDRMEQAFREMTPYEIALGIGGLISGLVVANLISIPIAKLKIVGIPLSIMINILFGIIGILIVYDKRKEDFLEMIFEKRSVQKSAVGKKLLDTSVIIDGRIIDIYKAGFLEGELIVPTFILEELRHISDSPDQLKRGKGRRGFDILNTMQKELSCPVSIEEIHVEEDIDVDAKLLKAAKKLNCQVLTIDYNLNKVASFHGVKVLNINELANAVKPIALPGEEMLVQVIKDGKENGQGIGYMDDGTMIVVEGGRKFIGETLNVTVTSVLQTAAGRMVFAKPRFQIEKVM